MTDQEEEAFLKLHQELTWRKATGKATPLELRKQEHCQRIRRMRLSDPSWVIKQDRYVEFVLKDLKRYLRQENGLPTSPVAMRHPPKTVRYPNAPREPRA